MRSALGIRGFFASFAALVLGAPATLGPIAWGDSAQTIPLHHVSAPLAATNQPLGLILGLKVSSDGHVVVNDAGRRKLLLFDSALTSVAVVADSSGSPTPYGRSVNQLIPYLGDSSIFIEYGMRSVVMLDGHARVSRVLALPHPADIEFLNDSRVGVDGQGRLVFRIRPRLLKQDSAGGGFTQDPDSAPLARIDFETRAVDTIARVKMRIIQATRAMRTPDGHMVSARIKLFPLSSVDDWSVLSDGTVAMVRGHDYHVDWLTADGRSTSTPKIPFDWLHVTDEDKQRLGDSVVKARAEQDSQARTRSAEARTQGTAVCGAVGRDGQRVLGAPCRAATGGSGLIHVDPIDGTVAMTFPNSSFEAAPPNEIPDYYPPLRAGAVTADHDGNLWILPTTSNAARAGRIVYDVVNRKGELTERVELPDGRSIAGFAPGGILFLTWRDSANAWHLEKVRVAR